MSSLWNYTNKSRKAAPAWRTGLRVRLGLQELETRDLPSTVAGYSPAQLLHAYGFSQLGIAKPGLGSTIAIVDAYLAPQIQADLTTFDARYNLPAAQLTVVNDGASRSDPTGGWQLETALDVEWAHAVAPYANIVLVEAANDYVNAAGVPTALLHAVSVASSQAGVDVVSMSWGVSEFRTETNFDSYFNKPGITFVAASGDNGAGTIWPAVSPNVVAVGGTTLQLTSTGTYVSETGWGSGYASAFWGGSGGGYSQYEPEPSYQKGSYVTGVASDGMRMSPDVSYVADPNTGVAVYDRTNGGWLVVGGTSAGTPQWAALVALADQVRAGAGKASLNSAQTLTSLYQEQGDFHDITSGNNGYSARVGYDLVTGLGTPEANLLVPDLAAGKASPAPTPSPTPTPTPTPIRHHPWWYWYAAMTAPAPAPVAAPVSSDAAAGIAVLLANPHSGLLAVPANPIASPAPILPSSGTMPAGNTVGVPPAAAVSPERGDSGSSTDDLVTGSDPGTDQPGAPAAVPGAPPAPDPVPQPTPAGTTLPTVPEAPSDVSVPRQEAQRPTRTEGLPALPNPGGEMARVLALSLAMAGALRLDHVTEDLRQPTRPGPVVKRTAFGIYW